MDFGPEALDNSLLLDYGVLDTTSPQVRRGSSSSSSSVDVHITAANHSMCCCRCPHTLLLHPASSHTVPLFCHPFHRPAP